MEGADAGKPIVGVGSDDVTGREAAVVHALDFVWGNDYKPGVFIGIVLVFIIESEIAVSPELDFEVEKIAGLCTLDYKIGHEAQGFAGGVVVFAQHGAEERMNAFETVVENVVSVAAE